ncbi:MAG: cytochrome c oxidase subunit II transmembrane domain-containing protein [Chitinophagaceae bacterium]
MVTTVSYCLPLFFLQAIDNPASQQAEKINGLFHSFNIAAAVVLLVVCSLVTWISIRYRQKKNDTTEVAQVTGNNTLEFFMIGVPALLLIYFFFRTITAEKR